MKSNALLISVCLYASLQTLLSAAFTTRSSSTHTLKPFVRRKTTARTLFRELITDDDEDLRADISTVAKEDGLESFLQADDRLCVIKLYAPFCKACKAFGVKFRKLAFERGDRINAAGKIVHPGIARFGEIEYSSNIKLCKHLKVKKFPTVLIYRGGQENQQKIGEIDCKNISIENLLLEIDQAMEGTKQ